METSVNLVENNTKYGPILKFVFKTMDGARFRNADYVNQQIQNVIYNGFNCDFEITNLLVFDFKGCLLHCGLHFPGSWNASKISYHYFRGSFGLLRLPLSADSRTSRRPLAVCSFLLNVRPRSVGLNQIQTAYADPGDYANPWIRTFEEEQNIVLLH